MCNSQASSVPIQWAKKVGLRDVRQYERKHRKNTFFSSQYKTKVVLNLLKTKWIQQKRNRLEQSRKDLTFPRKICTFF